MQSDQLLHEGQANPGAFVRAGLSALDPMEALEDPLTVLLGNPHPGIADLQFNSFVRRLQGDGHGALEGEFKCIG